MSHDPHDHSFLFSQAPCGLTHSDSDVVFSFGDRHSGPARLEESDPEVGLMFLNQIHSSIRVLQAGKGVTSGRLSPFCAADWSEGDAHWTQDRGLALAIRTADCLPVLIHVPGKAVAAIHAGWRGLESEIIPKTISDMKASGIPIQTARAVIGPHIGKQSFEVGEDVAFRLQGICKAYRGTPAEAAQICYPHGFDQTKRMVDLSAVARAQLIGSGIDANAIGAIGRDTFSDGRYHSFRRDGQSAGRQVSFIYLTPLRH